MTKPVQSAQDRKAAIHRAWRNWLLMFVPFFVVICAASLWFGFNLIMPVLVVMLVATLLYQRLVNQRSWRSIMWGVHASEE